MFIFSKCLFLWLLFLFSAFVNATDTSQLEKMKNVMSQPQFASDKATFMLKRAFFADKQMKILLKIMNNLNDESLSRQNEKRTKRIERKK